MAIIGGGPAGCAAGWSAARLGLRAVLLDGGDYPREKVCGECFSAEAQPLLAAMVPDLAAEAPRLARVRLAPPRGSAREFRLPRPALATPRRELDAALWRAAGAAGCELRPRVIARAPRREATAGREVARLDVYDVRGGGSGEVRARTVILAAGRQWSAAGAVNSPAPARGSEDAGAGPLPRAPSARKGRVYLGVKTHLLASADEGQAAAIELYPFPGGYCGLARVGARRWNACCLVEVTAARAAAGTGGALLRRDFCRWMSTIAGSRPLRRRLGGLAQDGPTVATAPIRLGAESGWGSGEALLAGDAAAFIDPWTGDGMARALLGGAAAGEAVAWALRSGAPMATAAARHAAAMREAARRSHRCAAAVRFLTMAPGWAQSAAGLVLGLPVAARCLERLTRWPAA